MLSDGCGGDLEGSSGVLTFPEAGHFPEAGQREYIEYRSHQDCYWTITVDVGMTMVLQFDMIDIEDGSTCQYDYVEVGKIYKVQNETKNVYLHFSRVKNIDSVNHSISVVLSFD